MGKTNKRNCTCIRTSPDGKRSIYVDTKNAPVLLEYLNQDERHRRKFNHICDIILSNLRNTELYDKENINKNCNGVTAMKFFKGQENDRIYCKELSTSQGIHIVITCELHEKKKNQKNKESEINLIKKVAGYEYEID